MSAPRSFVIGEGLLALQALTALRSHGHLVRAVSSKSPRIVAYCAAHGIAHFFEPAEFAAALMDEEFEFLFSVNNGFIVPAAVLARARRAAINFHDALLPRYGGLFASSWALLNGEREHGISWHLMVEGVDEGDVLVQRRVAVHPDDTAHTLNARCFEAACAGFGELLVRLEARELATVPHAPGQVRSYFGVRDRPQAAGVLDLTRGAEELARTVRALDFGSIQNAFAAAKCQLGQALVVVRRAHALPLARSVPAGTCLGLDDAGLHVATGDGVLVLSALEGLDGGALDVHALAQREQLSAGQPLPRWTIADRQRLDARFRDVARHERHWIARLCDVQPYSEVFPHAAPRGDELRQYRLSEFERVLRDVHENRGESATAARDAVPAREATDAHALVAGFIARMASASSGHIGWAVAHKSEAEFACFSAVVPLALETGTRSYRSHAAHVASQRTQLQKHDTYARDLVGRTPALRRGAPCHYDVAIAEHAEGRAAAAQEGVNLVFQVEGAARAALHTHYQLTQAQHAALDNALATFARAALARPDTTLAELPVLDADTLHELTITRNDTRQDYPRTATIHGLFCAQARRTPDAIALRHGQRALSYRELATTSDALATMLARRGVTRDSRVIVSMAHDVNVVISLLAVLKCGAAYVPVDPEAPVARRTAIVAATQPLLALCDAQSERRWADVPTCLVVDELPIDATHYPFGAAIPAADVSSDDIAYVIFTSGSTGAPKGVEMPHRGLVNHSVAIGARYGLAPGDRLLCSASIGFDVFGEQLYPALFRGAEVVIRPDGVFSTIRCFESFVRSQAITALILPTGFWHEWMLSLDRPGATLPPHVRLVCVGTEKVRAACVLIFERAARGMVRFFQGYGPTETAITCTLYEHGAQALPLAADVPIGRPLANVRAYVLDAQLRPQLPGFVAELYIAGDGLARGYAAAPELTRERFIADPFVPGERMYRTGDRVRFADDGQLIFVGRNDHQVKVRGHRVELGEIDHALCALPELSEAVVDVTASEHDSGQLTAYVVAREAGATLDEDRLRAALSALVPIYMVPSVWVQLGHLPRTSTQKIDRGALPAARQERHVEPQHAENDDGATPLERTLCRTVSELFRGARVATHDDFFRDLGGDSLLAVRLIAKLEEAHGAAISLSAFARSPTVAFLAEAVAAPKPAVASTASVMLQAGNPTLRPPLWLLPAVGGHVVYGEFLRRHMSANQPLFGLEACGLRGDESPLESVEAMAAYFVEAILRVQPAGPYTIAGPSIGGLVAWEIAQILARRGEPRVNVVLIDTWGPNYPRRVSAIEGLRDRVAQVRAQKSPAKMLAFVAARLRRHARDAAGVAHYDLADDIEGRRGERIRAVIAAAERASDAYQPQPFDGPVLLFHACRTPVMSGARFEGSDNGWAPLSAGSLHIVEIDTDHSTLADNPPAHVAAELDAFLAERACSAAPLRVDDPLPRHLRLARMA